jgi:hypothetical protein
MAGSLERRLRRIETPSRAAYEAARTRALLWVVGQTCGVEQGSL